MSNKGKRLKKRNLYGNLAIFLIIIAIIIFAYYLNRTTEINKILIRDGVYYEKAVVTRVIENDLAEHDETGFLTGTQVIEVEVTTGIFKGKRFELTNYANYINNVVCEEGTKLIVSISESGDLKIASVFTYNRIGPLIAVIVIFALVLCLIGGVKGFKSLLALAFTFTSIFFIFVPLIFRGVSPIFASIVLAIITTFVTMIFIDGWNAKTISAIIGTVICVVIAGCFAMIAGSFANVSDYTMPEADELIVIIRQNNFKINGLLFSTILIASLGAVMDICMSVASSINEVYQNNPKISRNSLFKSGMNVGRDMIGTMSNTLILAFTGGYLTTMIIFSARDITLYEIFSMPSIAIEIIQGIAGSIGIFLAVPVVSIVASRLMGVKINIISRIKKS